jgi:hypothetical protein
MSVSKLSGVNSPLSYNIPIAVTVNALATE